MLAGSKSVSVSNCKANCFRVPLKQIVGALLAALGYIAFMCLVWIRAVASASTGDFASYRGSVALQLGSDGDRSLPALYCAFNVVSFPHSEVFVWLHVLDSLVGK